MSRYLDSFHFSSDFPHEDFTLTGDDVSRVIPFPPRGRHAQVNAAYSAQLVELDRMETDRDRLIRDVGALAVALEHKRQELDALNSAIARARG